MIAARPCRLFEDLAVESHLFVPGELCMKKVLIGLACTALFGLFVTASPETADARPKYFARFNEAYGTDIEAVGTMRCAICHGGVNGANKKIQSAYAAALLEQITAAGGEKNCMDDTIIDAALTAVEAVESDPNNADGPTYGEILEGGELPAPAPAEGDE
jgi:hypothetical protein